MVKNKIAVLIGICLCVATGAIYWQLGGHDFINYDDTVFVTHNERVQAGLTWEGIRWAFVSTNVDYWHPLTMISHMLDCELFGLDPGGHHLTNVILHIMNSLLLFLVLMRLTGVREGMQNGIQNGIQNDTIWRSAFVAALFALHPAHVESVTWVAERKDLLAGLFWILTIGAYVQYTVKPGLKTYLVTFLLYVCALMSKPMVVTLPLALLLFDYWPLKRLRFDHSIKRLIVEKLPFIAAALIVSAVTYLVVSKLGIEEAMGPISAQEKLANALVAYAVYVEKVFWPANLSVIYPYLRDIPLLKIIISTILLVAISFLAARARKSRPYFVVGWSLFLIMLVPVIGFVQTGPQALADRYTYLPFIGLFIMLAWSIPSRISAKALAASAAVILVSLGVTSHVQARYWKDSISLFSRALEITTDNWLAHDNLGVALAEDGKVDEAMVHYRESLRIRPANPAAHNNLGVALKGKGQIEEAINHFVEALKIRPGFLKAHKNLESALLEQAKSGLLSARSEGLLGTALVSQGRLDEAIEHFSRALQLDPSFHKAHFSLGLVYLMKGDRKAAILEYEKLKTMNWKLAETLNQAITGSGKEHETK
ncbi:MAG TPA: hypothetical protein DCS07_01580 [Bdellovibrionales bacterium]|nr:MAG: hypothetical protein A2Z97_05580 [Bdellovibrionales bacterium GWB1_52_6]OFZ04347.1 MAG: hypothetical protein A2X97_06795 [Bdellovibrionales bacterium GWA1_52_35]OFZ40361.1 MAG: hypothetical protein A2070_15170 [Bdellovibrionales bacterium GWC1_52_8]HAR41315.1 hypothetical protein [Bdellovibrionales bacterium]HCM40800.1 hypothetical protein [Bdellovibrionales bacterium]